MSIDKKLITNDQFRITNDNNRNSKLAIPNSIIPELRFPEFENEGEWDKPTLSSVCDVIMGSSPSSSSYNEKKIGLPLLQGNADIKNRLSAPRIYTTEITKECEIGDILLSVRAPVGTVAKSLHNACIGRGLSSIRAKKPNSQEYIYQWLFSYESSWTRISQGGTFDAVNSDDIRNLIIPIPKEKEQQKIASCLSSLDEVIAAHSQKLELLKDHKKGLMQNLFPQEGETVPKYRFKEFEKNGDWVEKKLGEVADVSKLAGYEFTKHIIYESFGKIIALRGLNIKNNSLDLRDVKYIDNSELSMLQRSKLFIDDLMFTYIGTIGEVALIEENDRYYLAPNVSRIRPNKNKVFPQFLLQHFNVPVFKNSEIAKFISSSSQPALTMENVRKFVLKIPSLKEQQKIASCLSSLDALITAQAEKIEQLKLHKKGLMQGLFPSLKNMG